MSGRNPEAPRCSWCDARCRDQSDLIAHEAEHRREDERRDISTAQSCRDDARFEAEAEARELNQQREEAA